MSSVKAIGGLILLFALFSCLPAGLKAQSSSLNRHFEPESTRILFLLDASGSMKENWQGRTRFEVAKELLLGVVDSLSRGSDPVEFGLRVFGHQQDRSIKDCEDSHLELPFARNNSAGLKQVLDRIEPKGYTPIAYSLFMAAHDFQSERETVNVIVLITDGLESCSGDPCAAAESLRNQRVALKPYIIGMGLDPRDQVSFDCVGTYFDAADPQAFKQALGVVVAQALRNTTVQVNLLDQMGRANETDVEFSFNDAWTGEALYNMVHTHLRGGVPDTLYLDPAGLYDLIVYTTPPVSRQNIELIAGKHNIIAIDAAQGELWLQIEGNSGFTDIKCLVRDPASQEIAYVQNFNTRHRYLTGTYNLEILTLPRISLQDFPILPGQTNPLSIPAPGKLTIQTNEQGVLGVFSMRQGDLMMVQEWLNFSGRGEISLQPGEYHLVFRPSRNRKIDQTREKTVVVFSGKNSSIKLE